MKWFAALAIAGLLLATGCSSQSTAGGTPTSSSSSTAANTVVYEVPGMH